MIEVNCLVQAGQITADGERRLRKSLRTFVEQSFQKPMGIRWTVVPIESGFTAGKASTTSIVSLTADTPVDQPRRKKLLDNLCSLWIAETGCHIGEVVGVIADPRPMRAD